MALPVAVLIFLAVLALGLPGRSQARQDVRLLARNGAPVVAGGGFAARVDAALLQMGLGLSSGQVIPALGGLSVLVMIGAYALFHNLPAAVVIGSLAVIAPYLRLLSFERQRRATLALQFKEALTSISYSVRAGASLATAIEQALLDLHQIFPAGAREPIIEEFEGLVRQLRLGVPVEVVLSDWQARFGMEEITDFVSATLSVKSRGGNLSEVIMNITEAINWKIVAQAQVRAMTTEKRSEATLLTAAPAVVLALLWWISPNYIAPLFTTSAGQIMFLIGVILNIAAYAAVRKVLDTPL